MGDNTGIEWCDATWNPIVGCSIHSAGCTNCYAMKMAARLEAMSQASVTANGGYDTSGMDHYRGLTENLRAGPVWNGTIKIAPQHLFFKPLRWQRPRMIFVNSMSDLFHELLSDEVIDEVYAVMAVTDWHIMQVLTKRSSRMHQYLNKKETPDRILTRALAIIRDMKPRNAESWRFRWPLPNVWQGISAENHKAWLERRDDLIDSPATLRWVSAEPLIGPINFGPSLSSIDWIVVGGESGTGARPARDTWVRDILRQCERYGTAFMMKQWGEYLPIKQIPLGRPTPINAKPVDLTYETFGDSGDRWAATKLGKHKSGRALDGVEYLEMPKIGNRSAVL